SLLVLEPVVLELALAGLIADWAVDGVVQEEELLHTRAGVEDVLARLREDFLIFDRGVLTGRLKLRLLHGPVVTESRIPLHDVEHHRALVCTRLDLDETHPAVRWGAQAGVPAIVRDFDPLAPGRANDGVARLERDVLAV